VPRRARALVADVPPRWALACAIGENPSAAGAGALDVFAMRFVCVLAGGVLAGIGASYLVLSQVRLFTEHMTAGRGP
jgi:ABC-type uncharacterized transport system permease subunit